MADEVLSLSFLSPRQGDYPEVEEEEFYEKIEAPKFIDLTEPDPRRSGDDRYWFCYRVGCDQKHEEEMDSEAIYKNFVLRVMAARSPNVRLRKALCSADKRNNPRCPQTVPSKPSRPRMARLGLISSISKKLVDTPVTVKKKPFTKQAATPNLKAKQQTSSISKASTTTRNRKPVNEDHVTLPKKREVAKTLLFHSPKKQTRRKTSLDNVKTLCGGMKKLEIAGGKKQITRSNCKTAPLDCPKKQLRGRQVKSRVYDDLRTPIRVGKQIKPSKERNTPQHDSCLAPRAMETGEKSINGPHGEKELALASNGKEDQCTLPEGDDDKENASACDENRSLDPHHGKEDNAKGAKSPRTMRKPFKESSATAAQGLTHHLKPKQPTHPKPFRLRTDERGILKEANMEKKLLHLTPAKNVAIQTPTPTPTPTKHTVSSQKKAVSRQMNTPSREAVVAARKAKTPLKKSTVPQESVPLKSCARKLA